MIFTVLRRWAEAFEACVTLVGAGEGWTSAPAIAILTEPIVQITPEPEIWLVLILAVGCSCVFTAPEDPVSPSISRPVLVGVGAATPLVRCFALQWPVGLRFCPCVYSLRLSLLHRYCQVSEQHVYARQRSIFYGELLSVALQSYLAAFVTAQDFGGSEMCGFCHKVPRKQQHRLGLQSKLIERNMLTTNCGGIAECEDSGNESLCEGLVSLQQPC